jgi:prepilin-type N-terminal cleavage/methylation domain-containing protein/prepilin-type processing-associated H-X9-DG protein
MRKLIQRVFTLIELLIVIAIIAVLMAILLPSLSRARDSAKQIACLGNEKQQSTGMAAYVGDFEGWLPVSNPPNSGNFLYWKWELSPYLDMNYDLNVIYELPCPLAEKVFKCPLWNVVTPTVQYGGYGWNIGNGSDEAFGYYDGCSWGSRVKLSTTKQPSQTIICGETTDWADNYTDPSCLGYVLTPKNTTLTVSVGNRHRKGINMVWADGHLEWKTQKELLEGRYGDRDWYYRRVK